MGIENVDVDALAARLAALEAERDQAAKSKEAALAELMRPPAPSQTTPGMREIVREAQERQDQARAERRRRHTEWAKSYEEQLERVQPEVDRLSAQVRELEDKRAELDRKHEVAVAKVYSEIQNLQGRINTLQAPPEMPSDPKPRWRKISAALVTPGPVTAAARR
jgi:DNA repair exonuclease SbcCD ATPase subunit